MLRGLAVAAALTLVLGGCFGGSGGGAPKKPAPQAGKRAPLSEAEREAQERKRAPGKRLSARDRVAYYQVATTSGLLRARAVTVLSGHRGTAKAQLRAGRSRLDLLEPDSTALTALRDRLKSAADRLLERESRSSAKAAIAATDGINAALNRYSRGKAVKLLVPD